MFSGWEELKVRLRSLVHGTRPAELGATVIDDEGVRRQLGMGREEVIRWVEVNEIAIVTTSEGPWCEDLYFLLIGDSAGCAVPCADAESLWEHFSRLPGFDESCYMVAITAMGSTDDQSFQVWKRERSI